MFDATRARELLHVVGFSKDHRYNLYDLTESTSGLRFDHQTPYVTIKNLNAVFELTEDADVPNYDVATTYKYNDLVDDNGIFLYIGESPSLGAPTDNTNYWIPYSRFAHFLRRIVENSIVNVIGDWIYEKSLNKTSKNLLDRSSLVDMPGNAYDFSPITNGGVGFEIKTSNFLGVRVKTHKLHLHFNSNGTIPIRIYESGKKTAVYSNDISYTGDGSVQILDLDYEFKPNKIYHIGYDDTNTPLPVNAMEDGFQCTYYSKFLKSVGFRSPSGFDNLPDYDSIIYDSSDNRGLNIEFSAYCDYTDIIIEQSNVFEKIIALGSAIYMLEKIAHNPEVRVNRNTQNIDIRLVNYMLDGDTQGKFRHGLRYKYRTALREAAIDTSGIDRVCLPCRRRGMRHKSAV